MQPPLITLREPTFLLMLPQFHHHPIQIRIEAGFQEDGFFDVVESVKSRLRQIPTTRDVGDDWGFRTKKILITVDQARARRAGAPDSGGGGGDISRPGAKLVSARGRSGIEPIGQDSLGRAEGGDEVHEPDASLLAALDARVHRPK